MLESDSMTVDEIRTEILNSDEKKSLLVIQERKTVDELSSESKQIIDDLYREILLRPADTEAFEYWGSMLESEIITKQELRKNILNSDEALALSILKEAEAVVECNIRSSMPEPPVTTIDSILAEKENPI